MILDLSGKSLDTVGTHLECETGYWTVGKICLFLSAGPKMMWLNNCLKVHSIAVFLIVTVIALVNPFGFLKQAGGLQLLATGPIPGECQLI